MKSVFLGLTLAMSQITGCGGSANDLENLIGSSSSSSSSGGASSSSGGPITHREKLLETLKAQRKIWESYGISEYSVGLGANYAFAIRLDVVLHVKDGEVLSVLRSSRDVNAPNEPMDIATEGVINIEQSFDAIEAAAGAYILEIQYHPTYGFPTQIRRDTTPDWFDDEDEWWFTDFVVIQ